MNFSHEMQEKINVFAKEQAQYYIDNAEMTYMEKLQKKARQTKGKVSKKLARFKMQSDQGLDAQNDMVLYMSDYMNDLMSKGFSEHEAFEKASLELKSASQTEQAADLHAQFLAYYESRDPAEYEAIGLLYGGFVLLGLTIGGLIGFILGGGRGIFLKGGWVDTLIGVAVGTFIGSGLGLIGNGVINIIKTK